MYESNELYEASFEPLNRNAESSLVQKMKSGDLKAREILISLKKALRKFENIENGHDKIQLAGRKCGINSEKAANLLKMNTPCVSLDAPLNTHGETCCISDFLTMLNDSQVASPETDAINACFKKAFYESLCKLPKIDQNIFVPPHQTQKTRLL